LRSCRAFAEARANRALGHAERACHLLRRQHLEKVPVSEVCKGAEKVPSGDYWEYAMRIYDSNSKWRTWVSYNRI